MLAVGLNHYLFLSAIIFSIGILTVLLRKNLIVILMGIELMLNAVNLSFIAFSHFSNNANGPVIVFFVMTLAAAEAGVGLALMVTIFKRFKVVDISIFEKLKN
ncbi:MAG: NADH-quinone oxidoreductase subunit NuoK [Bdellovibrionaceae bacterium]|nr:NADH-quinone oxidoreductase subunit NuoK [Pseudobdellovibrionaceae bacterium]